MNKKLLILAGFMFCAGFVLRAQWNVNNGFTATQLGNVMAGSNVTINNATIAGAPTQFGTFSYTGTGFPLNNGIILSTGSIFTAPGPNINGATSGNMGGPGDPDLTAIAGQPTFDRVAFQFDFEVQSDKIEFTYVFASEEYNEFVGSSFNDVFAFFISGPGITGWQNIALVPGTSVPVAINNINNGSFWQFYRDNETGNPFDTEFDGFTIPMVAKREGLIPCNTYTLRMVIADAGDPAWDAAVFLQANSLVQGNVSALANTVNANGIALEGCIQASFTFNLDTALATNLTIPILIGGTAINGVDYAYVDSLITIPAGFTSASIIIDAFADGLTEGQESIALIFQPAPCAPLDTVWLFIDDAEPIQFQITGTDLLCAGDNSGEVDISITGGFPPYTVMLTDTSTLVQTVYTTMPITGLAAGGYLVEIEDTYGCFAEAVVIGGDFDAGVTFLPDGTGVSYTSSIPISGFNAGQTLTSAAQINSICANMEHSYANDLTIVLQAPNGSQVVLKSVGPTGGAINACDLGEPVASGPVDTWSTSNLTPGVGYDYCWTNNPTFATMNAIISATPPGPPPQHTYVSTFGNTLTDYYLPAGSYTPIQSFNNFIGTQLNGNWTLIVTDNYAQDNGYIFNWSLSLTSDLPDSIVVISEPTTIDISGGVVSPACGAADGEIDITVSGINPPFTFSWSNGATTEDISGIAAGSYTVTVTDAVNCTQEQTFLVSNASPILVTANIGQPSCNGLANGSIDLTASNGSSPYSFLWNNSAITEDISGLTAGNYSVTITDAIGCVKVESFTVSQPGQLLVSSSITNESCSELNGAIALNVIGGTAPYSFVWSNGATTQNILGLQQGSYSVTVADANGCNINQNFTLINLVGNCLPNCDLIVNSATTNNETCGQTNGSIFISATSGYMPIVYTWSNGATTSGITGLAAGNYSLDISDNQGCQYTQNFTITNQTGSLTISGANVNNENCGNSNGSIDIGVVGGNPPYAYSWSNGATTQDLASIGAGTYNITVTDNAGCTVYNTYEVLNIAGTLVLTYGNAMPADCGLNNGSIDIQITGGQPPYSYLWSNGATTQDLLNLPVGNYQCAITDATGCSISTPVYQVGSATGGISIINLNISNETCGNGQGSISYGVTGGATPYSYLWNTGANTQNLINLSGGTYSATVTDANGCSVTTGNLVVQNTAGTLQLNNQTVVNEVCGNGNGAINITVSGGTAPLTYLWNGSIANEDLYGISAGSYSCVVTDASGCQLNINAAVNNNPGTLQVANVILNHEQCGDGSGTAQIILQGEMAPVIYNWSNGNTTSTINGLQAGTYTCNISDASGCSTLATAVINNSTGNLSVTLSNLSNETCNNGNGSIGITVSGGSPNYTYAWSNGAISQDISGLSAGQYSVTVTDAVGCQISLNNISITSTAGNIFIAPLLIEDEQCNNGAGEIRITVNGQFPFTFLWSNGATTQDIAALSAGSYTVEVTDGFGCSAAATYTVANDVGNLALTGAILTDATCVNPTGAINITVQGDAPFTYQWTNGANTEDLSGLGVGGYQVLITDNNGCQITSPVYTINSSPGALSLVNVTSASETCGNSLGTISPVISGATNPVTWIWNNSATTQNLSGLSAGVYTATVTDAAGCSIQFSATVQNLPGTLQLSSTVQNENCGQQNGAIDLTVSGAGLPVTYQWSNGATTEDISTLSAGIYTVTVSDANGCQANWNSVVGGASGAPQITTAIITDENCSNSQGSIVLTVTGGTSPYTYVWNSVANCCSYTIQMQDSFGDGWNGGNLNVSINGTSVGTFAAVGFGTTSGFNVCQGDQIIITYTPGAFEFENTYAVTNASGQTILTGGPTPTTGVVYIAAGSCSASGTGGSTLTNLNAGQYDVTITDAAGCTTSSSFVVNNAPGTLAVSNAVVSPTTCQVPTGSVDITVIGGTAPYTYSWSNGASSQDVLGLSAGTYSVTVSDQNGCTLTESYTITDNTGGFMIAGIVTDDNCLQGVGGISLAITGGTSPYVFNWSNGSSSQDIINVAAGTYSVTVLETGGCQITETFTINNITNGLAGTAVLTNDNCNDGIGAIDLIVTGGSAPYNYNWSNGAVSQDISGLNGGTYSVNVTDQTGCSWTDSFVITNSGLLITGLNVTDASCGQPNGSIQSQTIGGTAPITYEWTLAPGGCCSYKLEMSDTWGDGWNGGNLNVTVNGASVGIFAAAGFYSEATFPVCEGDAIALTYTAGLYENENSYNLVAPSGIVVFSDNPNPATGLVYTATASCGYTISGTQNYTGIPAGNYTLTVTDANGCSDQATATVNDTPGNLNVTAQITNENCGDGTGAIDLTIAGNSGIPIVAWQHGPTTEDLSGLSAGAYSLTVFDQGCEFNGSYTVFNVTGGLNAIVIDTVGTYCGSANGAIDIAVTGGSLPYTFIWNNGASTEDITGLIAGSYSVTISDATGCEFNMSANIPNGTNGLLLSAVVTPEYCGSANGTVDLTVTGGTLPYSVAWNHGPTTEDLTGLAPGTYNVSVTDQDGCTDYLQATVIASPNTLYISNSVVTDEYCGYANGGIDITVSGGQSPYSYSWNTGATTQDANGLIAGSYDVTVTDANGCTTQQSFNLVNTAYFAISNGMITNATCATCADGAINIFMSWGGGAQPNFVYYWSNGAITEDISGLNPGIYMVVVTDSDNGCSIMQTFVVGDDNGSGVIETTEETQLVVFPNPTTGQINVSWLLAGNKKAEAIEVYDIAGKLLITQPLQGQKDGQTTINLETLSNGIYSLILRSGEQRTMRRVVIAK